MTIMHMTRRAMMRLTALTVPALAVRHAEAEPVATDPASLERFYRMEMAKLSSLPAWPIKWPDPTPEQRSLALRIKNTPGMSFDISFDIRAWLN